MKTRITIVIVVIFCAIVFLYSYKSNENSITTINYSKPQTINKEEITIIQKINKLAQLSINESKKKNLTIYDENRKPYLLKDLVGENPKLIFKFSETQCSHCIEHALKYIEIYKKEIGINNIILIGNFIDEKSYSIFVRFHPKIHSKIYQIDKDALDLSVDSLNQPYLIFVNTSLRIQEIFVPLKEIPERTDHFFKKVIKKTTK